MSAWWRFAMCLDNVVVRWLGARGYDVPAGAARLGHRGTKLSWSSGPSFLQEDERWHSRTVR